MPLAYVFASSLTLFLVLMGPLRLSFESMVTPKNEIDKKGQFVSLFSHINSFFRVDLDYFSVLVVKLFGNRTLHLITMLTKL